MKFPMLQEIVIHAGDLKLEGHIATDPLPKGWVIFAHGSGSSRHSSRNNWVAKRLNQMGFATFLFDLLTIEEDSVYTNRFNIPLLANRLLMATEWLVQSEFYRGERIAYFGASTGAGAALIAAAKARASWPLYTVISRGGRPDLAGEEYLKQVSQPVLLIVGDRDYDVIKLNEEAQNELPEAELELVTGATHLFEEPGALDRVVDVVGEWLESNLPDDKREVVWME
jgi:putative phosphoribosyl transferase